MGARLVSALWVSMAVVVVLLAARSPVALVRDVRVGAHPGFTRLVIEWDEKIYVRKVRIDQRLVLHLEQPIDASLDNARSKLKGVLRELDVSPDGKRMDIVTANGTAPEARVLDDRLLVIDIPNADATPVRLRTGRHETFDRLVIEPVKRNGYETSRADGRLLIKLDDGIFSRQLPNFSKRSSAVSLERVQANLLALAYPEEQKPQVWFLDPDMIVVDMPVPDNTAREKEPTINDEAPAAAPPAGPPQQEEVMPTAEPQVVLDPNIEAVADIVAVAMADETEPADREYAVAEAPGAPAILVEKPAVYLEALRIGAIQSSDGPAMVFHWQGDVAAASFLRGGRLWLVFDGTIDRIEPDTDAIRDVAGRFIRGLKQLPHDTATILLLEPSRAFSPLMRRDGASWQLLLEPKQQEFAELQLSISDSLLIGGTESSIRLEDPTIGDRIGIAMTSRDNARVASGRRMVDLDILSTFQGAAWSERADGLQAMPTTTGVLLELEDGLTIDLAGRQDLPGTPAGPVSEPEQDEASMSAAMVDQAAAVGPFGPPPPVPEERDWTVFGSDNDLLLDFAAYKLPPGETLADGRKRLGEQLTSKDTVERADGYVSWARLHLAHGLGGEAMLLLARAEEIIGDTDVPVRAKRVVAALRAAASLLMRRDDGSLFDPAFDPDAEIGLWRAAAKAGSGEWDDAQALLSESRDFIWDYPQALQVRLGVQAARIGLESGRADPAFAIIDRLSRLPLTPEQRRDVRSIEALALWRDGSQDDARSAWTEIIDDASLRQRLETILTMTAAEVDGERLSPKAAAKRLRDDRVLWRGHEIEADMFEQLGSYELAAGSPAAAIVSWRTSIDRGAEPDVAVELAQRMRAVFADYLSGELAQGAPALEALQLYRRYSELLPGDEKGSAVVAMLVAKLEEVGVYEPAIELLERQLALHDARSRRGAAIGSHIADLLQRADKSQSALAALADTTSLDDISPELSVARAETAARALASMSRYPEAEARLSDDGSVGIQALRVELAAGRNDWQQIIDILGTEEKLAVLDKQDKFDSQYERSLMRLAVALYQLGRRQEVGDLAGRFDSKIGDEARQMLITLAGPEPLLGSAKDVVAKLGTRLPEQRDRLAALR